MVTVKQVKTGYKETDVGNIPTDWNLVKLSDGCSKLNVGFVGICEPFYTEDPNSVLLIRTGNLNDGNFTLQDSKYVTKEFHRRNKKSQVNTGDLLIARHGESGMAVLVPDYIPQANTLNIVILRTKKETLNNVYAKYAINSTIVRRQVQNKTAGSTQGVINTGEIADLLIPTPDIREQEILANTLEDVDILIHKLNQLIEKKRNIKQGTMQELLTGKRRLSGFIDKWEEVELKNIADFMKGQGLSKGKLSSNGKYPCVLYGELFTTYTRTINDVKSRTDYNEGLLSKIGDILIPGSTTTVGIDLATASAIELDNILLGGDIIVIRKNKQNNYNSYFLANYLTYISKYKIAEIAQGITIIHLHGSRLKEITITIPTDKEEQNAIAQILHDMNKEIVELENQKNKYIDLKQGMMQKLLTGRIRLI